MRAIDEIRAKLCGGRDPFVGIEKAPEFDMQGWPSSQHPYLADGIAAVRPRVVVEVGVWKGVSAIFMADELRKLDLDAVLIAVDTWLGNWVHWAQPEWTPQLKLVDGYPSLYRTFASNVVGYGLQNYIVPLPLDSLNASELMGRVGIAIDVLHLDAGHTYTAVIADLSQWWQSLRPGGMFIGDDYAMWPSTRSAIDDFLAKTPHSDFRVDGNKCSAIKRGPTAI